MPIITAIRKTRGGNQRCKISLDGKEFFSLSLKVCEREGLKVDQELSSSQIETLKLIDNCQSCYEAAMGYLSYRPRSQSELAQKLVRRGFCSQDIDSILAKLKEQGLVNDQAFAQFWNDNRQSFRPRSRSLTSLELKRKGISSEIIETVVSTVDEVDSAYRAAETKAKNLPKDNYHIFRQRLSQFLLRRGFSYEVISRTVSRLWNEYGNDPIDEF
ncbi:MULTISPECIES: regulatory protein RecX [Dehalococcoides]|jgi:regulatory protein|uniref:Regulatory protein RecX n=2 Tax=Dehalococcoides mccartyi TaxID=61435 RepID=A0A142VDV6_9CHLR|nr:MULTISPECIES: regulatory protein RecX [Dehalococcoides]AGG07080.1 regulatory protein RecX [Dehalococcoides mccartyi DCMB5]AII61592.1 RecX family transcriptional regulator [Dehalococcoides mccartyi CG5]AMU87395.1 regulatory protein [Dehalococcoides mccartyi]AOW00038.1 regulatory protein RecX [Dehalococcoides mccartyi]AQU06535.1 RecX family transcriptional regulator [Dehalococcoides mccartyi]